MCKSGPTQKSINNSEYLKQREYNVKDGCTWIAWDTLNEEELSSDNMEYMT